MRLHEVCPVLRASLASSMAMRRVRGLGNLWRYRFVHPDPHLRHFRVFFVLGSERVRLGIFADEHVAALAVAGAMVDPSLRHRDAVREWLVRPTHLSWVREHAPDGRATVARVRWRRVRRMVATRGTALFWQECAVKRAYDPCGGARFPAEVAAWEVLTKPR